MKTRLQLEVDLRRWLSSHHGVVSSPEARALGAPPSVVRVKVRRGEWERLYRGVFLDSAAPPGPHQDLRAACVAAGHFSVASHASAAWVWELLRRPPVPEVIVPRGAYDARRQHAYIVHQSSDLYLSGTSERNGIPVTNPLRTLVDLAGTASPATLTEAVDTAIATRLVTVAGLEAEIGRLARRGRPGVATLRRHLGERGFSTAPEPSVLEAHLHRLVASLDVGEPTVEYRAGEDGEYRLDIAWPAIDFAVEVDGYAWHFTPEQKARDETRRNRLRAAGWTVLVYGWRQVVAEPATVAREITATYHRLAQASRRE